MVLPRNVEVDPSIPDLKSGRVKRPEEVTITTQVRGLFGPMTNTTVWSTQYDHENEVYREDIVFKEGWLITGRKKERVMPWHVAGSHIKTISLVGGVLFKRKKYTMHRLYGSRNSYVDMIYEVSAEDSKGEDHAVLLASESDASLWRVLMRALHRIDLGVAEVEQLKVKTARNRHHPTFSLAKTIDLARKNSLRLRFNLFTAIEDISRGEIIRTLFDSLEKNDMDTVKEWTKIVWDTISDTKCPKVWE
ncbi:MAG: hypothetical protein KAR03_04090 [Candidatus Thorarchaeota archaeon]|nr:hypothetical protein [Candidatus Thorarchaeota archaeon]